MIVIQAEFNLQKEYHSHVKI